MTDFQLRNSIINKAAKIWLYEKFNGMIFRNIHVAVTHQKVDLLLINKHFTIVVKTVLGKMDLELLKKQEYIEYPYQSIGDYRLIVTDSENIKPEDVPEDYGLLKVDDRGKLHFLKNTLNKNGVTTRTEHDCKQRKDLKRENEVLRQLLIQTKFLT